MQNQINQFRQCLSGGLAGRDIQPKIRRDTLNLPQIVRLRLNGFIKRDASAADCVCQSAFIFPDGPKVLLHSFFQLFSVITHITSPPYAV